MLALPSASMLGERLPHQQAPEQPGVANYLPTGESSSSSVPDHLASTLGNGALMSSGGSDHEGGTSQVDIAEHSNGPLRGHEHESDDSEKSPWARKTVLTLDGGGVRGYSSLLILKELMRKIATLEHDDNAVKSSFDYPWDTEPDESKATSAESNFYPCHYFDYMAGTSTGGLSAIMLGRLRMSVDEALASYTDFGNSVFGCPRWWHERSLLWFPRSKYPSKKIKGAILRVINKRLQQTNPSTGLWQTEVEPFASPDYQCRTMVVAFSKDPKEGIDDHYLFRTYDHPEALSQGNGNQSQPMNPGPAYSGPLWHAARATSAAPIYFESIKFDDRKFLDGGLGANNPGMIALKEVDQMHASSPVKPEILVSIGTGMKKEKKKTGKRKRAREEIYSFVHADTGRRKQFLKKYFELAKYAKDFTTNPQGIADNVKFGANKCGTQHERFDVEEGLGSIKLDDWRPPRGGDTTLEQIRKHTRVYLDLERTQTALQNCAITLVHLRRHRATTERWEKFATDIKYHCPAEDCKKGPAYMWHREHLRKHFEHRHQEVLKDLQDELETFIDTGRVGKLRQSPLETIVDAGRFKPGIFEEERPSHIQSALKRLSPRNTNLTSQSAPLDRLDPLENHNGSSRSVSRRLTRNTT